jgi:hypothetical protein
VNGREKVLTLPAEPTLVAVPEKVVPPAVLMLTLTSPVPSPAMTCQERFTVVPTVQVAAAAVGAVPPPQGFDLEAAVFQGRGVFKTACPFTNNKKQTITNNFCILERIVCL